MILPQLLKPVLGLVALVLLMVLAPKLQTVLEYIAASETAAGKAVESIHTSCQLSSGVCVVSLGGDRQFEFHLYLAEMSSSTTVAGTFSLRAKTVSGEPPRYASLKVEGRDMFMGIVTRTFEKEGSSSLLVVNGQLPACSVDPDMVWLLTTSLEYDNQIFKVIFDVKNAGH